MVKKLRVFAPLLFTLLAIILANGLSKYHYIRIDFTDDKRYTLSDASRKILTSIKEDIRITVFLSGDFPADFKRLEYETLQILEEFRSINEHLFFKFTDPYHYDAPSQVKQSLNNLKRMGLAPTNIKISRDGEEKQKLIFPWAIASMGSHKIRIPLLKTRLGTTPQIQINNSVENLEYTIVESLSQLTIKKRPQVDILLGHGEWPHQNIYDFGQTISKVFNIQRTVFQIDPKEKHLKDTIKSYIDDFKKTDIIIVAKPTKPFNYSEKYILDQFIMGGGKVVWLLESVVAEMDSLLRHKQIVCLYNDLNLKDQLFRYGVRINPVLLKDLNAASIRVASGNLGHQSRYESIRWPYFPLAIPDTTHPIVNNIDLVKLAFAGQLDTLTKPEIKKSILLQSSPYSKLQSPPSFVKLQPVPREELAQYAGGRKLLGVLLEGRFSSAFKNRIPPAPGLDIIPESPPTQMVVISDGDIIANQMHQGRPLPLGYDKWTRQQYGNKDFMVNVMNYLFEDKKALMSSRIKNIKARILDKVRVQKDRKFWQYFNLWVPCGFVFIMGGVLYGWRKWKYRSL